MSSTFWVFVLFSLIMINCLWLSRCFGFFVRFKSLPGWYKRTHLIIQIDTSALHIFFIFAYNVLLRVVTFYLLHNWTVWLIWCVLFFCSVGIRILHWIAEIGRIGSLSFKVHCDFNANKNWRSINPNYSLFWFSVL